MCINFVLQFSVPESCDLNFKLKVILQAECEGNRNEARQLHTCTCTAVYRGEANVKQWTRQKGCVLKEMKDGGCRKKQKSMEEVKRLPITI